MQAWNKDHAEQRREYMRKWSEKNREKIRERAKTYYHTRLGIDQKKKKWAALSKWTKENPGYAKEWCVKNRVRLAAKRAKRRLLILSRIHPDADLELIAGLYVKCYEISKETGIKHEVDHIIPVIRGGYHHQDNMQILPESLNRSKGHQIEWRVEGYKSWKNVPRHLWPEELFSKYDNK